MRKDVYPSGIYTQNSYDAYGNLIEVKDHVNRSIWKANTENARRQLTSIYKGTKETVFGFDSRGLPTSIVASGIEDMSYSFDSKGNLFYRTDNLTNQKEQFTYDGMNRLTNWDVYQNGSLVKQNGHVFDAATGNITSRTDLNNLTMAYGGNRTDGTPIGPHALSSISGVPASFPTANLNITYTDFKKVASISEGNKEYYLSYGVDEQRRKSEYKVNQQTQLTRYYVGGYEEEIDTLGNVRKIHYLSGGALLIQNNGVESLLYGYSDFQGSLIALTDESGNVVERYAYDPWGARRNPNDWTQKDTRANWITNRGYTGHEHIDAFGIINMNGRVYDPATGMFLSPDPYVQAPKDWLNYNRYSYCMGNPFKYTDPSGKLFKELLSVVFGIVSVPLTIFSMGIDLLSGKSFKQAWNNSPLVAIWSGGKMLDDLIFGKDDPNITTGQPGAPGSLNTPTLGPEHTKYYEFKNLKEMVNFMWDTSENKNGLNPNKVEVVGYALYDEETKTTTYYVLDWNNGYNTNHQSSSPSYQSSNPNDKRRKFDGKYITALYHTHPTSYYESLNNPTGYDGSSYLDLQAAQSLGVPVYSIGPTSVSVITPNSVCYTKNGMEYTYNNEAEFNKLAENSYGYSTKFEKRRDTNPFYLAERESWLNNPY